MFGFLWYIVRQHQRPDDQKSGENFVLPEDSGLAVELRQSWLFLPIGVAGVAMFWGLGIGVTFFIEQEEGGVGKIAGIVLILFGFSSAFLITEYFRARHYLTASRLKYQKMFGGAGTIQWNDIAHVRFGLISWWIKLTNHTGDTIRVSAMSRNSNILATRILKNVDQDRIDPGAHKVLIRIASGEKFSVWPIR